MLYVPPFRQRVRLLSATCLPLLGLGSVQCASIGPDKSPIRSKDPELILTEAKSFRLAAGENVLGAVELDDRVALYWGPDGMWVLGDSGSRRQVTCRRGAPGIVGTGRVGEAVLIIDSVTRSVFEVQSNGECKRLYSLPVLNLLAATITDSGWLALNRRDDGKAELLFVRLGGTDRSVQVREVTEMAKDTSETPWLFLSTARQGAIVGSHRFPFSWARLDPVGAVSSYMSGEAEAPIPGVSEPISRWYALPPIDLGDSYLRVLADLTSDTRRFELYDGMGRFLRSRDLVFPIAFFSARNHNLLGVRITDATEIVRYSWRWR